MLDFRKTMTPMLPLSPSGYGREEYIEPEDVSLWFKGFRNDASKSEILTVMESDLILESDREEYYYRNRLYYGDIFGVELRDSKDWVLPTQGDFMICAAHRVLNMGERKRVSYETLAEAALAIQHEVIVEEDLERRFKRGSLSDDDVEMLDKLKMPGVLMEEELACLISHYSDDVWECYDIAANSDSPIHDSLYSSEFLCDGYADAMDYMILTTDTPFYAMAVIHGVSPDVRQADTPRKIIAPSKFRSQFQSASLDIDAEALAMLNQTLLPVFQEDV